jgi:hypothetical protein
VKSGKCFPQKRAFRYELFLKAILLFNNYLLYLV